MDFDFLQMGLFCRDNLDKSPVIYMLKYMSFSSDFLDLVRFEGTVQNGLCWDFAARQRLMDERALESYGYKVYSQNDEDGIIHEIFRRIGCKDKTFVEFGVQNGLESNCHLLLHYGWRGLFIEGSKSYCDEIAMRFKPVITSGQLKVLNAFITRENINDLLREQAFSGEIDLLSIDVDGNDYYIWEAISAARPRVLIIEYNGKFPPDLDWKQAYNAEHIWDGSDWHGASLKAYELLGREKGYRLVGTNLRGVNAFFVREDLCGDKFYPDATAEALYNPLRHNLSFTASHPARYCLVSQKDGLGLLNYRTTALLDGFHAEEGAGAYAWTSACTAKFALYAKAGSNRVVIPVSIPPEVFKDDDEKKRYRIRFYCKDNFDVEEDADSILDATSTNSGGGVFIKENFTLRYQADN